ncbi:hypothetical protein [Mesorhizobium sp. M0491]|uniref:hypothetical protein n=1 Tax=Mesorhizobium sp. M0491 TaxID=2956950 RepID=UPI003335C6DE
MPLGNIFICTSIRLSAACLLSVFAAGISRAEEISAGHPRSQLNGHAFQLKQFQVEGGSEQAAIAYYKDVISKQLFPGQPTDAILSTSIADLLAYFGHTNVKSSDLHALTSQQLMALGSNDEILAIRFFAPKITDVAEKPTDPPAGGFGWRKLVRFKAKAGSPADSNGIGTLYVLQNTFEATATGDPFDPDRNVSKFNQVIITRKLGSGPYTGDKRPTFFMTYGPFVKLDSAGKPEKIDGAFQENGPIIFNLKATFDEDDRDPETNSAAQEYFVADSCQQCHGGFSQVRGKLNFLDTDHWFDRVLPEYGLTDSKFNEEDFTSLAQSPFGLLYDGGKDTAAPEFASAFDAIRKFNEEVKAQNTEVGGGNNFQLNAVTKWLELHGPGASGINRVPPAGRGFGTDPWNPAREEDRKLVYYLNRYCYRCHSSVSYNVFDRAAVAQRVAGINERAVDVGDSGFWMPQDRIFPGLAINQGVPEATEDLREFLDLLNGMQ